MNVNALFQENVRTSSVIGASIYDHGGELIGQVDDVVIGRFDGRIKCAVLSFGRYFGFEGYCFPLPWSELDYNPYLQGFVITHIRQRLKYAPRFKVGDEPNWNDRAWVEQVLNYHRNVGYNTRCLSLSLRGSRLM